MTENLRIIKNNVSRKLSIKGSKYREVRTVDLEKGKRCILEGLKNCISNRCSKNGIDQ